MEVYKLVLPLLWFVFTVGMVLAAKEKKCEF